MPDSARADEIWADMARRRGKLSGLRNKSQQNTVSNHHGHPVQLQGYNSIAWRYLHEFSPVFPKMADWQAAAGPLPRQQKSGKFKRQSGN